MESKTRTSAERISRNREYFNKLCKIVWEAEDLTTSTLKDEQLQTLSVRVLERLNVDGGDEIDLGPRYYEPMTGNVDSTYEPKKDAWHSLCNGKLRSGFVVSDFDDLDRGCYAINEAADRQIWFNNAFQESGPTHLDDLSGWKRVNGKRDVRGYEVDDDYFRGGIRQVRKDGRVPHIQGTVVADKCTLSRILRGEVITAAQLLKEHLRAFKFASHSIFPILLFTIQHDRTARISQIYFDGEYLNFRCSRTLDLAADQPTPDAYLILRWMASQPIGKTLDYEIAAEESGIAKEKAGTSPIGAITATQSANQRAIPV